MVARIGRQILFAVVIIMIGLAVPYVEGSAIAKEKKPVKIGLVTWREGPALEAGRSHVRAFEDAIKYINEKGGILGGRKVEGVVAPQGQTGETAKASALKLAMKEGVKALIGPHWTMAAPAGLSVAKKYNLPFLAFQGGTWLYKQNYMGTAIFAGNAYGRTNAQMKWVEQHGFKRAVMLFSDIPYNHDVEEIIKTKWDKPGSPVKPLEFIYYTWGQTEIKKELTKAVGLNPDIIWSENWSSNVDVALITSLRELGYKGSAVLTPSITWNAVQKIPKEISEGTYVASEWIYDPNIAENKAFHEKWVKDWGYPPQNDEEVVWQETIFVLMAMDKAGTEGDGTVAGLKKISNAMRQLKWVSLFGTPVKLTEAGLATWDKLAFTRITNGEFILDAWVPVTQKEWWPLLGK